MKRKLLLTTLLLTTFTLLQPSITTHAAGLQKKSFGNVKIITCPLPNISLTPECNTPSLDNLKDYLQSMGSILCPPATNPDTDKPVVTPPTTKPDTDKPVVTPPTTKPDTDKPVVTPPTSNPDTEAEAENSYVNQVVKLVNEERTKVGLAPLTLSKNVSAAANTRAKEIQTSFSHTRPNGSSFATALKEHNVSYKGAGENIAWGQKSPKEVVNAWMNSTGHRANILNAKYTTIGVGHVQNAKGTNYWCQLFTY